MKQERIEDLINLGLITQIIDAKDLVGLTEKELMDKYYITHVVAIDGDDNTIDEEVVVTPAEPTSTEPTKPVETITQIEPEDDAPEVDNGDETPEESIELENNEVVVESEIESEDTEIESEDEE